MKQCRLVGVRQAAGNAVKQSGDHIRFRPSAVRFVLLSKQNYSTHRMDSHTHQQQCGAGHKENTLSLKSNHFSGQQDTHLCFLGPHDYNLLNNYWSNKMIFLKIFFQFHQIKDNRKLSFKLGFPQWRENQDWRCKSATVGMQLENTRQRRPGVEWTSVLFRHRRTPTAYSLSYKAPGPILPQRQSTTFKMAIQQ